MKKGPALPAGTTGPSPPSAAARSHATASSSLFLLEERETVHDVVERALELGGENHATTDPDQACADFNVELNYNDPFQLPKDADNNQRKVRRTSQSTFSANRSKPSCLTRRIDEPPPYHDADGPRNHMERL